MIFGKPNESKKITGIHGYEIKILDSLGRDIEDRSRVSLAKPKPEEIRQPQGFWYILPIKAPYQEKFVISIVENINNQHYETIYSNSLGPIN